METINNLEFLCSQKHVFELQNNITELKNTVINVESDNEKLLEANQDLRRTNQDLRKANELLRDDKVTLEWENRDLRDELKLFMVNVYGIVNTTGENTRPVAVTFENDNVKHWVQVSGSGFYSIRLENNRVYKVTVRWQNTILGFEKDHEFDEPFEPSSTEETYREDWVV